MKRHFTTLAAFLALAAAAPAQQGWFVDPAAGNDGNGGQSQGDAFRSLTHALTQAAPGDNVFCLNGTYGPDETFPIGVRDGVRISALAGSPVFDGGAAATLFSVAEDITQPTELSGLGMTDATTLFLLNNRNAQGLLLTACSFSDCTNGIEISFPLGGGAQDLTIDGCTFTAAAGTGDEAIYLSVPNGVSLEGGGVTGNQILGDYGTGIALSASGSGAFTSDFTVERNQVSGCNLGLALVAQGNGNNPLSVALIDAAVNANRFTGDGGPGTIGIEMLATIGAIGEDARISSFFRFNEIENFETAIEAAVQNDGNNLADVTADFYGNLLSGAGTGVRLTAVLPNPINRNADPNFGGHPQGGAACLNTFLGFTTDFVLAANQTHEQYACFCWWDGVPFSQNGILLTPPLYDDPLVATLPAVTAVLAGAQVTVTAGPTSGFVDFSGGGGIGQILVEVDGVALAQSDIEVADLGVSMTLTLPALAEGQHTLEVTNPGGQTGDFDFEALLAGLGSEGCFVATAAHGDYDAPEVLALRGLRDEYLTTTAAGRGFIRWYYREGPRAAAWIAERPWARTAARAALQPAVLTSRALTGWTAELRFAFAVLLLGLGFAALRRS